MRAGLAGALLLAATAAAAPTPRGAPPAHARTAAATAPRRAGAAAAPRPPPEECCWCDEDTPAMERTMTDSEGHALDLVFSDEFSTPGRDFSNGKDKRWTALDKGDDTNDSPMYYHPQAVTTVRDEGAMVRVDPHNESVPERTYRKYPDPVHALQIISTNISDTPLANRTGKQFAGGMVQSWVRARAAWPGGPACREGPWRRPPSRSPPYARASSSRRARRGGGSPVQRVCC